MGENTRDTVKHLLALALEDEKLPEGAEKRCIERVAAETGPLRLQPRPEQPDDTAPEEAPAPEPDAE